MTRPRDAGAATRREAMEGAIIFGAAQRTRILAALLDAHDGLTADDLEVRLSMSGNSVRPRLRELEAARQVTRTARTRRTRSGSLALVWVAGEVTP